MTCFAYALNNKAELDREVGVVAEWVFLFGRLCFVMVFWLGQKLLSGKAVGGVGNVVFDVFFKKSETKFFCGFARG